MNQGLCMFDAQGRIAIWNERYRQMYNIDPRDIWRGCNVPDLLASRMKAGTFPLDPDRYDADLRAAFMQGRAFTLNVDLKDGRTIAVVNQPMPGGGWVATHEDVSERKRAERELESTRTFHKLSSLSRTRGWSTSFVNAPTIFQNRWSSRRRRRKSSRSSVTRRPTRSRPSMPSCAAG